jgi:hypothetical protein
VRVSVALLCARTSELACGLLEASVLLDRATSWWVFIRRRVLGVGTVGPGLGVPFVV